MTDVLRWGVLGTGGIAHGFAREVAGMSDCVVVAVGSRTDAAAKRFADAFAVPHAHDSVAALVGDDTVDAVYVATPHPAHAGGALAAIAAGKHVLVEKPFTMDAAEAVTVVDAARAAGVFCMEAMWTRFLPHVLRLRELLAAGAVGQIRTVVADHGQYFTPDPAHRMYDPALGGGALLDLGIYPVSWAHLVLGAPATVTAVSAATMTGVDAQTTAILGYPDGAQAIATCTLEALTPRRSWISGSEGTIEVDPVFYAPSGFTLTRRDGTTERFDPVTLAGQGKGMRYEIAEVVRCVAAGLTESPAMPLDETVAVMRTMDQIARQIGLTY